MNRLDSIDVMRATALILMVPCHFVLFLSAYRPPYESLYTIINEALGGLSAPLFLFLVGTSQAVSLANKPTSTSILDTIGQRLLRRSIAVLLIAFVFKTIVEASPFEWGILTLISASLAVLCFVRQWHIGILLLMAILIFFVTPALRGWVGYTYAWGPAIDPTVFSAETPAWFVDVLDEYLLASDERLLSMLKGFLLTGYFPLLPWLIFPLLGFVLGKLLFLAPNTKRLFTTAAIGVGLCSAGTYLANLAMHQGTPNFESGFQTSFLFFPLTPSWLLVQLGFCLLVSVGAYLLFDKKNRSGVFLSYCRLLSRYSLSAYVIHYLFAYWPPRIANALTGPDTQHFGNMVSVPIAILLSLLMLQSFFFIFSAWDEKDGKFSFEWVVKWLGG